MNKMERRGKSSREEKFGNDEKMKMMMKRGRNRGRGGNEEGRQRWMEEADDDDEACEFVPNWGPEMPRETLRRSSAKNKNLI
jgi:hypothetical protein